MFQFITRKKKILKDLAFRWGKCPVQEYSADKFLSIAYYYSQNQNPELDIDDITWNDLDMDNVYCMINNTASSMGEEYLYALLRKPFFDVKTKEERDRVMEYLTKEEAVRLELQYILSGIGKIKTISLYEYMSRLGKLRQESNKKHYCMILMYPLSLILTLFQPTLGLILLIGVIAYSVISYFSGKAKIEAYYSILTNILRSLKAAERFQKMKVSPLSEYQDRIKDAYCTLKPFKSGSFIVNAMNGSGNITDIILDYVRILTHLDLILFQKMLRVFQNESKALLQLFETFGFLDSMIACASFRSMLPLWCKPELGNDLRNKAYLELNDVYHPLIEQPVCNSISTERSILLTGSNASGKSTFIKTVAINAILSQTIATAVCRSVKSSFFRIASSMALSDNLTEQESYYIVEIKSLKRILNKTKDSIPMLCFIDEVLRGTNTTERIAASSVILRELSQQNCICFAATHDLELSTILKNDYDNYHFQEQIEEDEIRFDYLLYEGVTSSQNAIRLLEVFHYPKSITQEAKQLWDKFQKSGSWVEPEA